MAIDILKTLEVIESMENFLARNRPTEDIRPVLDFGYKIENQSIIIFEIRPDWINSEIIREHPVARTTYIKAKMHWKVFWLRANMKWESYQPKPIVKTVNEFVTLVEQDELGCFWG
jgi:hypothetical protein